MFQLLYWMQVTPLLCGVLARDWLHLTLHWPLESVTAEERGIAGTWSHCPAGYSWARGKFLTAQRPKFASGLHFRRDLVCKVPKSWVSERSWPLQTPHRSLGSLNATADTKWLFSWFLFRLGNSYLKIPDPAVDLGKAAVQKNAVERKRN